MRAGAAVIVTATTVVVVGVGVLVRVLDHEGYPNVWVGMWWALQTVTTVGYGDVAPKNFTGRIVGAAVMLQGIAFVAIVTAAITSTFVARATRRYEEARALGRAHGPRADRAALRRAGAEARPAARPARAGRRLTAGMPRALRCPREQDIDAARTIMTARKQTAAPPDSREAAIVPGRLEWPNLTVKGATQVKAPSIKSPRDAASGAKS